MPLPKPGDTMTALFPLVSRAKQFAALVQEPGWSSVTEVKQMGHTVTWVVGPDAGPYHFSDLLETVGSIGSDHYRKARLNGVTAPVEY